jgi:hypothetical protein
MTYAFIREVYSEELANKLSSAIQYTPNTDPANDPFSDLYNLTGVLIPPTPAPSVPPNSPTRYGVVVYPGVSSLELYAALEYLHFAPITFNISLISLTMDPITTNILEPNESSISLGRPCLGQTILPSHTLAGAPEDIEVLIIPGAPRVPRIDQISRYIAQVYPGLRHLLAFGTGAALVAQSE